MEPLPEPEKHATPDEPTEDEEEEPLAESVGEQPEDRDLMPGDVLREPNAPVDRGAGDY
jgi:hypothetical protein